MRSDREWMYQRLDGRWLSATFVEKVEEFIEFACAHDNILVDGKLKCPCKKCMCISYLDIDTIKLHLYKRGFRPFYYQWSYHGEEYVEDVPQSSTHMPSVVRTCRKAVHKFVDERSKMTWERYESIKNSRETQEETAAGDNQVFLQAVGGWTEKGTVYGLGSAAQHFYERPTPIHSTASATKYHNLENKVDQLESERQRMQTQLEEQNRMILALKNMIEAQGFN
ncbi:hypothetical protein Ancab_039654 [Ancistrocladus abbreviatus]